jgi:hypothetical protein
MPIFREIEEGRVGKRPFLQPLTWFGRNGTFLNTGGGLSVNADKTSMGIFTNNRKLVGFKKPALMEKK